MLGRPPAADLEEDMQARCNRLQAVNEDLQEKVRLQQRELEVLRESANNVAELKKAEQALRESEQTLRATLESTADGILVVMEDGEFTHFNERFVRMWGFAADLMQTRDISLLLKAAAAQLQDPQTFINLLRKSVGTMQPQSDTLHLKDGRIFERFSCPLIRDGCEIGRVSSVRDVTANRQSERLAAIGEMVAGLAHESRNAMQRMQACLEMLALEVQDRPEALDLLNRMQAAQDRLHHLHEEVREYAAPIVLNCAPVRLDRIVRDAWQDLEIVWSRRTVQFHCFAEQHEMYLDRLAVESVFRNVFENSLAAGRDPVVIDVRCEPAALNGRMAVEIVVRDNGPGLNPQQQRQIFKPFYTTKTHGTGLGLAISKRLIEAHDGRIAARSAAAGGAEIAITLPKQ